MLCGAPDDVCGNLAPGMLSLMAMLSPKHRWTRNTLRLVPLVWLGVGCASPRASLRHATAESSGSTLVSAEPLREVSGPMRWFERGVVALQQGEPARAVALLSRYLGAEVTDPSLDVYPVLARAHEELGDCNAAIRAYTTYLGAAKGSADRGDIFARRGACEAETLQWARSAASYAQARSASGPGMLPSEEIERLARGGYALYTLGEDKQSEALLVAVDAVLVRAQNTEEERFSTYYFVGMARFYRAALLHRRFRAIHIRPSRDQMAADFQRKLDLLAAAQVAYNHTISAKHVYWVSAAGYQLGALFEEFYDALMYAPVPSWLRSSQRNTYYEELKKQLRPVVNKAIWVFEKNLETARRLGYSNNFTEQTQARLSELQAILLASDTRLGEPTPHFSKGIDPEIDPDQGNQDYLSLPAQERRLFVPRPTPL